MRGCHIVGNADQHGRPSPNIGEPQARAMVAGTIYNDARAAPFAPGTRSSHGPRADRVAQDQDPPSDCQPLRLQQHLLLRRHRARDRRLGGHAHYPGGSDGCSCRLLPHPTPESESDNGGAPLWTRVAASTAPRAPSDPGLLCRSGRDDGVDLSSTGAGAQPPATRSRARSGVVLVIGLAAPHREEVTQRFELRDVF